MGVSREPQVKRDFLGVEEVLSGFPVTPLLVGLTNNKAYSFSGKVFLCPSDTSFAYFMNGVMNWLSGNPNYGTNSMMHFRLT